MRPTEDRVKVPRTDGYDLGHDFGHERGGPANLPVVPDRRPPPRIPPVIRAKPTGNRTPDALPTPAAHMVVSLWVGPVATLVTGVPSPDAI